MPRKLRIAELVMELLFTDGSPFARLVRVLIGVWQLPISTRDVGFPLPEEVDRLTPLGQVPVLIRDDGLPLFPTLNIVEHLAAMAGPGVPFAYHGKEREDLTVALAAGDAVAQAAYLGWAGLGPVGPNRLGLDLRARNLGRFNGTVRWLAERAEAETVTGLAIAVFLGWAGSRNVEGVELDHPSTAAFRALLERPEVAATAPRPIVI